VSGKFFARFPSQPGNGKAESGLLLRGSLHAGDESTPRSVSNVTILGGLDPENFVPIRYTPPSVWTRIRDRLWPPPVTRSGTYYGHLDFASESLRLPESVATELKVKEGDSIRIRFLS